MKLSGVSFERSMIQLGCRGVIVTAARLSSPQMHEATLEHEAGSATKALPVKPKSDRTCTVYESATCNRNMLPDGAGNPTNTKRKGPGSFWADAARCRCYQKKT
jgi:hypothetical protein